MKCLAVLAEGEVERPGRNVSRIIVIIIIIIKDIYTAQIRKATNAQKKEWLEKIEFGPVNIHWPWLVRVNVWPMLAWNMTLNDWLIDWLNDWLAAK